MTRDLEDSPIRSLDGPCTRRGKMFRGELRSTRCLDVATSISRLMQVYMLRVSDSDIVKLLGHYVQARTASSVACRREVENAY